MDELDRLLDCDPLDKFIDVLQHAPRGSVELTMIEQCKEIIALRQLLEQMQINHDDIQRYIFENDNAINEAANDIYIDLTAKILGQEG